MSSFQIFGTPLPGTRMSVDGQVFELVAVQPYQRRDGGLSSLITWRGPCADCAAPFDQTTGTGGNTPRRRCPPCRTPGVPRPVSGRRGEQVTIQVIYPGGDKQ
jgi:hypothetical protein